MKREVFPDLCTEACGQDACLCCHLAECYRQFRTRGWRPDTALEEKEDIIQDAMFRAWERCGGNVEAFLAKIRSPKWLKWHRAGFYKAQQRYRSKHKPLEYCATVEGDEGPTIDPSDSWCGAEDIETAVYCRELEEKLSTKDLETFNAYVECGSGPKAAEKLGLKPATFRKRLCRARARIKRTV